MSKLNDNNSQQDSMKAFIMYQDFTSCVKASALLHQFAQNPNARVKWNIRPWRVNILKFPRIAEEALEDAEDAHLMVFAGCSFPSLPVWLQSWLDGWAKRRLTPDAAMAVIHGGNVDPLSEPLVQELSRFAKRQGLSFIVSDGSVGESVEKFPGRNLYEQKLLMGRIKPGLIINTPGQGSNRGWGMNYQRSRNHRH
jgi:hypothetical protein